MFIKARDSIKVNNSGKKMTLSRCFYKTLTIRLFRTQSNIEDGSFYKNCLRLKDRVLIARLYIIV